MSINVEIRDRAKRELSELLKRRFPIGADRCDDDAQKLFSDFMLPRGELHLWNPNDVKHFDEVLKLTRKLCAEWNELSFAARSRIRLLSDDPHYHGNSGAFSTTSPRQMMEYLSFGTELIEEIKDEAREIISQGKKPGRRDYRAIRVVVSCQSIWESHTGELPKSENHASFMDLLDEVFSIFGPLGLTADPSSAVQAWRRHGDLSPE